jgi:hypothetical protein
VIPERVRKASMFADSKVYIDAFAWSDGSVSIETQDLRGEEHEHFVTVRKPPVPHIREGGPLKRKTDRVGLNHPAQPRDPARA